MRIRSGRAPLATGLVAAGMAWLYGPTFAGLVRQWSADDNYSHGFFVIPLAAFFAWERRETLLNAPRRPSAAGAVLVAISLLLFAAGTLGAELFLTRVSLLGVLAGAVLFVWGRAPFQLLLFPMAFLLLMIPLPAIVFNQIAFPLQLLASEVGESAIVAAGIPVLREGNVLHLPARTLEVAEACSGIRSLVSLLMMAIVVGYFFEPRVPARVALAFAAVPIAILANAARVAGTGLMAEWIGPEAADGFFHGFSGWLMFIVALAGLVLCQRLLSRVRLDRFTRRPATVEVG